LALDVLGPGRVVIDQVSQTQNLGVWPLSAESRPASRAAPTSSGAPERWLTRGASVDRQPVFSPDGKRLLFNSDRGGNLDLWQLEMDTGSVRRVTVAASEDWDPSYTGDGERILWSSNRSGN
jgi:Tol biopolymer transport system component